VITSQGIAWGRSRVRVTTVKRVLQKPGTDLARYIS